MKHRIQMRAAASALAACICLSALPGALAAEPGRVKAPGRTEMEHGPVSTEFASTRLAFAVSDPVTNADDTVTLDVAYADSQGTKHERVTPTGMTETDVALITVADYPVKAGCAVELCYNDKGEVTELHPKSWTRKSTKGVQKSMGKELFSEELKLAVVQYVLEGHTRKEASEKFCVSCTPIEKWVNLYKLHGAKGLLSRNLVGRQKGFDGEFRLKVLQYKQEHHLSCTQTAMHFCLDVVTVCRWEKKFQKEGAQGLMKKQATKGSEKRQKKQEQSELQQENKRLSEENYRLKMENDYLKKLNALIQKREKPE